MTIEDQKTMAAAFDAIHERLKNINDRLQQLIDSMARYRNGCSATCGKQAAPNARVLMRKPLAEAIQQGERKVSAN